MINLLPPEDKRARLREFHLRLVVVGLSLTSCAVLIANAFVVPWFVAARAEVSAAQSEASARGLGKTTETDNARAVLTETNKSIALLKTRLDEKPPTYFIQEVLKPRTSAITISSIAFSRTFGQPARFVVAGVAEKRSDLVAYRDALKALPTFTEVTLPFADLAKSVDVSFTLTLIPALESPTVSTPQTTASPEQEGEPNV